MDNRKSTLQAEHLAMEVRNRSLEFLMAGSPQDLDDRLSGLETTERHEILRYLVEVAGNTLKLTAELAALAGVFGGGGGGRYVAGFRLNAYLRIMKILGRYWAELDDEMQYDVLQGIVFALSASNQEEVLLMLIPPLLPSSGIRFDKIVAEFSPDIVKPSIERITRDSAVGYAFVAVLSYFANQYNLQDLSSALQGYYSDVSPKTLSGMMNSLSETLDLDSELTHICLLYITRNLRSTYWDDDLKEYGALFGGLMANLLVASKETIVEELVRRNSASGYAVVAYLLDKGIVTELSNESIMRIRELLELAGNNEKLSHQMVSGILDTLVNDPVMITIYNAIGGVEYIFRWYKETISHYESVCKSVASRCQYWDDGVPGILAGRLYEKGLYPDKDCVHWDFADSVAAHDNLSACEPWIRLVLKNVSDHDFSLKIDMYYILKDLGLVDDCVASYGVLMSAIEGCKVTEEFDLRRRVRGERGVVGSWVKDKKPLMDFQVRQLDESISDKTKLLESISKTDSGIDSSIVEGVRNVLQALQSVKDITTKFRTLENAISKAYKSIFPVYPNLLRRAEEQGMDVGEWIGEKVPLGEDEVDNLLDLLTSIKPKDDIDSDGLIRLLGWLDQKYVGILDKFYLLAHQRQVLGMIISGADREREAMEVGLREVMVAGQSLYDRYTLEEN